MPIIWMLKVGSSGLEVTAEDMPDATPSYETLEMLLRDLAERGDALATTIGEAMELHFEDEPGTW